MSTQQKYVYLTQATDNSIIGAYMHPQRAINAAIEYVTGGDNLSNMEKVAVNATLNKLLDELRSRKNPTNRVVVYQDECKSLGDHTVYSTVERVSID